MRILESGEGKNGVALSREADGPLVPRVPPAPVRMSRRGAVAEGLGAGLGRGAVLGRDDAVLEAGAHPLLDVGVQLAAGGAALAAVDLASWRQHRQRVLLVFIIATTATTTAAAEQERSRVPPHPLHVVRPLAPRRERHAPVHRPVHRVEVPARERQAHAVDGVQEVEDGVVQLRRQVRELQRRARLVRERHRLVVHDRVRPRRPRLER